MSTWVMCSTSCSSSRDNPSGSGFALNKRFNTGSPFSIRKYLLAGKLSSARLAAASNCPRSRAINSGPSTEQYIEHVSPSDRSIQMLDDVKDPRRSHYIFKILLTGVEPAYQIAHPGEKDHTNVDRVAWISTFEEALAKTIVHIVLSRQAEQTSQAVGSPKE